MDLKRWKLFQHLDPGFASDVKHAFIVGMDPVLPARAGVLLMKNGDVYSIADNAHKIVLLGVNNAEAEDLLPHVPVKIEALCGQKIREISSGCSHVAVLTTDGRIYQWGQVCFDAFCGTAQKLEPEFWSGVIETERVVQVACGLYHTLALTSEGEVYSRGRNYSGQLGTGGQASGLRPVKITGKNGFDAKISSVACGDHTSFAVDKQGKVWGWGDNKYDDASGRNSEHAQMSPTIVLMDSHIRIKKIATGSSHVLALSNAGELYFWGRHDSEREIVTPTKIKVSEKVIEIGATQACRISCFKTSDGNVYFWGYAYDQLFPEPLFTRFTSIADLFASRDIPVMLKPLELDLRHPIVEKLSRSFNDKETSDVAFSVERKLIYAHKMVLKLRSDYFGRMFDNDWKENAEAETGIEIPDCSYKSFSTFLLYLYIDRIEPLPRAADEAIELFKLADYYGEEDLQRRCEQQLELLITEANFTQVYACAVQHNSEALHNTALNLGIPHLNAILLTEGYKKMPDELKIRLIDELAKENVFVGLERKKKQPQ